MVQVIPRYEKYPFLIGKTGLDPSLALANSDMLLIARTAISGIKLVDKFGRNPDIDKAAEQDIFSAGGNFVYPTANTVISVVSDDAEDDPASSPIGTGCHTVKVYGCDSDYNEINEIITLSGTTPVGSATSPLTNFFRVWRVMCMNVGTSGANVGNIKVVDTNSPEGVLGYVTAGNGQSEQMQYTVPAGKTAHIPDGSVSIRETSLGTLKETTARVHLWVRDYDETSNNNYNSWRLLQVIDVNNHGSGRQPWNYMSPILEKSDIRMSAIVGADNTQVDARAKIVVIDN